MNIILLSGGSGKRLWPISNDVRSKQFIKLFKKDDGEYESMVQRVYRQISKVNPNAKITIATSSTQVSAIRNQLGNMVSTSVEPCRRDTCPAIILACTYLRDELQVGLDETVVVCPVDPYVDDSYYEAVASLDNYVQDGKANLTLMGIEPTVPSNKYGYIIPDSCEKVSHVKEFKEKPDIDTARRYIESGALWNAGVFAFKLKYLIDIAHKMLNFADYKELFTKYELLEKISFDYAVVEKEKSVQVVRYSGAWKDVGTWNMMSEIMSENTKGNVTLDEYCKNTHVVNELEIPILCMGCKNMIVAASSDGIFVSEKERSGSMKNYVEKISTGVRYAEKSWGTFNVIDVQTNAVTIKISLDAGKKMTYHRHDFRDEVWTITSGKGVATVDGMEQQVKPGDIISIAAGCKHTIKATTDMQIIEVQVGNLITVEDKMVF